MDLACFDAADEFDQACLDPDSDKRIAVSGAFGKTLRHMTKLGDATDCYAVEE